MAISDLDRISAYLIDLQLLLIVHELCKDPSNYLVLKGQELRIKNLLR